MRSILATAIALPALTACTLACAQNSVNLSGAVDMYAGYARWGNSSSFRLLEGGNTASHITFSGNEALGSGTRVRFYLEAGINPATGAGTIPGPAFAFSRQAYLGLSGPWGQLDGGRMYTPMFYTLLHADPYKVNTVFSPLNLIAAVDAQPGALPFAARANSILRYRTPADSQWLADIAYAGGQTGSNAVWGGTFGWNSQPYYVGYGFQRARPGSANASGLARATTSYQTFSGSYTFKALRLTANYVTIASSLQGVPRARLLALGAQYPVTQNSVLTIEAMQRKVQGSNRSQLACTVGYDYALSKRTALYSRWLLLNNRGPASASLAGITVAANSGNDPRVFAIGIRHKF